LGLRSVFIPVENTPRIEKTARRRLWIFGSSAIVLAPNSVFTVSTTLYLSGESSRMMWRVPSRVAATSGDRETFGKLRAPTASRQAYIPMRAAQTNLPKHGNEGCSCVLGLPDYLQAKLNLPRLG
jgi:hypothetical protein